VSQVGVAVQGPQLLSRQTMDCCWARTWSCEQQALMLLQQWQPREGLTMADSHYVCVGSACVNHEERPAFAIAARPCCSPS